MRSERLASRARIQQFIEADSDTLLNILRLYVVRGDLATHRTATSVAAELMNEVVIEALKHADRLKPSMQPLAWLLGIASNLIKRKRATLAKRNRREPLARDLYSERQHLMTEDEIFDQMIELHASDPAHNFETNERVSALLADLPEGQQRILRLAILQGLNGDMLARELGISPGAARARLHRALNRLRKTYRVHQEGKQE